MAALLSGGALAGCGGSGAATPPVAGQLEHVAGSPAGRIVLTQAGAERIGLQTVRTDAVPPGPQVKPGAGHPAVRPGSASGPHPRPTVMVPYSAIVYAPSGQAYAFTKVARLTYAEVPITIDHVSGDSAYLLKGPAPGSMVVAIGAEELYGVQTGVLAQT